MTKVHLVEKRSFTKRDGTQGYGYGFLLPNGKVGSFSSSKTHPIFPSIVYDDAKAIELDLVPSIFGDKMNLKEAEEDE